MKRLVLALLLLCAPLSAFAEELPPFLLCTKVKGLDRSATDTLITHNFLST